MRATAESIDNNAGDRAWSTTNGRAPERIKATERLYGIALFDGGQPGTGWSCLPNGEAVRIYAARDLGTEALWLTNLSYEVMRDSGLQRNPWMLASGFLRINVDQMLNEWGLKAAPPHESILWLADFFGRIMRIATNLCPDADWSEGTLAGAMASVWPEPEEAQSEHQDALDAALLESMQEWSATPIRPPKGALSLKFWIPRAEHFRSVMSVPLPVGPWTTLMPEDLPPDRDGVLRLLLGPDQTKPILARVNVPQHSSEEFAEMFSFGGGVSRMRRGWCSQPELLAMQGVSRAVVDLAFQGSRYDEMPAPRIDQTALNRLLSPIGASSWSAGVVLENLWLGACRPTKSKKPLPGETRQRRVHSRAVWLRAQDRILTFLKACMLSSKGWHVTGYGTGALWVSAMPNQIEDLVAHAYGCGLVPALTGVQDIAGIRGMVEKLGELQWGGEAEGMLEALARCSARGERLAELDGLPDMDDEGAIDVLTRIMEEEQG